MFKVGGRAISRRSLLGGISLLAPAGLAASRPDLLRAVRSLPEGTLLVGPVLQNAHESGMSLVAEVAGEASVVQVEYGPTPGLGHVALPRESRLQEASVIHHFVMEDLLPDTRHYYSMAIGAKTVRTGTFRTPPPRGSRKPFRFAVYSDTQHRPEVHRRIVERGILANLDGGLSLEDELGFVLIAGDVVNTGSDYTQYHERLFGPAEAVVRSVPVFTVIGNHELDSPHYWDYVNLPRNGSPGFEEHWYSFDYGNAHVIGLDTNGDYRIDEQLAWLEADLAVAVNDPRTDVVFAFFHHPSKSELCPSDGLPYAGEIIARLEAACAASGKVGACFYGHTHGYQRGQSKDAPLFWVNVGSAGGSLDRWQVNDVQRPHPEYQVAIDEYGVVLIDVNPEGRPGFSGRRFGFGCEEAPKVNELQDTFALDLGALPPAVPSVESAHLVDREGTLILQVSASPFSGGARHLEAEWQTSETETFDVVGTSTWTRREKLFKRVWLKTELTLAEVDLTASRSMRYVRVRYRGEDLAWSLWSMPFRVETSRI